MKQYSTFTWGDGKGSQQQVKLQLTKCSLFVQREETLSLNNGLSSDSIIPTEERKVIIEREKIGGLGLSVKGGCEHNLPILISRIFTDQAADKTGQLYVGDRIVQVNDINIEKASHEEAVMTLVNAGDAVALVVKYFKPASLFLSKSQKQMVEQDEENNDSVFEEPDTQTQWVTAMEVPLLFARLTCFMSGTDKQRPNSFEVFGLDGAHSGVLHNASMETLDDWMQCILSSIARLNREKMASLNISLNANEQIHYMSWVDERLENPNNWQTWMPTFIGIKGANLYFHSKPMVKLSDWSKMCSLPLYETMFGVVPDDSCVDRRQNCCVIETVRGDLHYLSFLQRDGLLEIQNKWYSCNLQAIRRIHTLSFDCTWNHQPAQLTLNFDSGFHFGTNDCDGMTAAAYKFSQLKNSSDDGCSSLTFSFQKTSQGVIVEGIECSHMKNLLIAVHAFLSARLAQVDPSYLYSS